MTRFTRDIDFAPDVEQFFGVPPVNRAQRLARCISKVHCQFLKGCAIRSDSLIDFCGA